MDSQLWQPAAPRQARKRIRRCNRFPKSTPPPRKWACQDVDCKMQGGPSLVRLQFGGGTVRAVPVFGSSGSSGEGRVFQCFSTVSGDGMFLFRFRSDSSGSSSGSWKNGSDGSDFRFRFWSWTILKMVSHARVFVPLNAFPAVRREFGQ